MPALLPILSAFWAFATSQVGVLVMASMISYGYGHHKASVACEERIAVDHARALQIHNMELVRQAKAAEAIAFADSNRAAEATKNADTMQAEIESLKAELSKKGASNAQAYGCFMDGDFIKRLQRFDRSKRH